MKRFEKPSKASPLKTANRSVTLALLTLLLTLHPAAAENIEVTGTLSATVAAEVPWPAAETSINVTGPDRGQDGAVVRAAFVAEL